MNTTPIEVAGRPLLPSRAQTAQPKDKATPEAGNPAQAPVVLTAEPMPIAQPPTVDEVVISSPQPNPQEASKPSFQEQMAERVKQMVSEIQQRTTALQFEIDEDSKDLIVRVVNKETGKVLRQIPPDELIQMRQQLQDMRGVLFSEVS